VERAPNNKKANAGKSGMVRLWDVTTGAEGGSLHGHTDGVNALCLLRDGRPASGSLDNTIRLWDLRIHVENARLEVVAPIWSLVAIAPNRIIAGDQLGPLHWLEVLD
jgi:WD40 repeat protein